MPLLREALGPGVLSEPWLFEWNAKPAAASKATVCSVSRGLGKGCLAAYGIEVSGRRVWATSFARSARGRAAKADAEDAQIVEEEAKPKWLGLGHWEADPNKMMAPLYFPPKNKLTQPDYKLDLSYVSPDIDAKKTIKSLFDHRWVKCWDPLMKYFDTLTPDISVFTVNPLNHPQIVFKRLPRDIDMVHVRLRDMTKGEFVWDARYAVKWEKKKAKTGWGRAKLSRLPYGGTKMWFRPFCFDWGDGSHWYDLQVVGTKGGLFDYENGTPFEGRMQFTVHIGKPGSLQRNTEPPEDCQNKPSNGETCWWFEKRKPEEEAWLEAQTFL